MGSWQVRRIFSSRSNQRKYDFDNFLGERTPCKFQHCDELRQFGAAQAPDRTQGGLVCRKESAQTAECRQQLAREFHSALAGDSGAQEQRDQLRVGKHPGAKSEQTFARPLGGRPV